MDILEIKDRLKLLYSRYGIFVDAAGKLVFAILALIMIQYSIGTMTMLGNPLVMLMIAVICALAPRNLGVLILAADILIHGYAMSMEIAAFLLLIMFLMFLFYFRFSSGDGSFLILMPILFVCHIPFAGPVAAGLVAAPFSLVAVACGTVMYFILNELHVNYDMLVDAPSSMGLANMSEIAKNVFTDTSMYMILIVFAFACIAVYIIRRLSVAYSWLIACGVGILIQLLVMLIGYHPFGIEEVFSIPEILLGNIAALLLGGIITLLCHNIDYKKTEHVQFEDDDYYYYVKAVPKITTEKKRRKRRR